MNNTQLYMYFFGFLLLFFMFRLRSFIFAWINVMKSQGGLFLVRVRNPTQDYFRSGLVANDFLYYKARKRLDNKDPNRMIPIRSKDPNSPIFEDAVYRSFGVNCIDVDDGKNCIVAYKNASYWAIQPLNAEAIDEMIKTAQMKPSLEDGFVNNRMFQIITLVAIGLVVFGLIYIIRANMLHDNNMHLLYDDVQTIKGMLINITGR